MNSSRDLYILAIPFANISTGPDHEDYIGALVIVGGKRHL